MSNIDYETNSEANQYKVSNLTSNKYIQLQWRASIYKWKIKSMISGLMRSYYIISSMPKISPIHQFILDKADFRIPGPKRSQPYLTLYIYPELLTFLTPMSMQKKEKTSSIHSFILEIQQSPYDLKGHTYIWPCPPNNC